MDKTAYQVVFDPRNGMQSSYSRAFAWIDFFVPRDNKPKKIHNVSHVSISVRRRVVWIDRFSHLASHKNSCAKLYIFGPLSVRGPSSLWYTYVCRCNRTWHVSRLNIYTLEYTVHLYMYRGGSSLNYTQFKTIKIIASSRFLLAGYANVRRRPRNHFIITMHIHFIKKNIYFQRWQNTHKKKIIWRNSCERRTRPEHVFH